MHRFAFPACPVDGPIRPEQPFEHGITGAVPKKCRECPNLFEGECTRFPYPGYAQLDHGPCGEEGPTDPIEMPLAGADLVVEIPRKCASCRFLRLDFRNYPKCAKDSDVWGQFSRSFDWADWTPERLWLELDHVVGEQHRPMRRELLHAYYERDKIGFVKAHRKFFPDASHATALGDYASLDDVLHAVQQGPIMRKNPGESSAPDSKP